MGTRLQTKNNLFLQIYISLALGPTNRQPALMKDQFGRKRIRISPFTLEVIKWVKKIPRGRVATYGQIAKLAGKPHGARGVGWILNACAKSRHLPWHRVINSKGRISFPRETKEAIQQKRLLTHEGLFVTEDLSLDLKLYQWEKTKRQPPKSGPRLFPNSKKL